MVDDNVAINGELLHEIWEKGADRQTRAVRMGLFKFTLSKQMRYCQIWCMPMKSSGDLVGLFDLFSVNKFHAFNNLCQVFEAA